MRILAIDLAVKKTGWALIEGERKPISEGVRQHGVIIASSLPRHGTNRSRAERNLSLYNEFYCLPWDGVTDVVIERPDRWMRAKRRFEKLAVSGITAT